MLYRLAAFLAAAVLLTQASGRASTINTSTTLDTFDFSISLVDLQDDQVFTTINGFFSGTADQTGFVTLTDFFIYTVGFVTPAFFSYDANGGDSSFDIATTTNTQILDLCTGLSAAIGGNVFGVACGTGGYSSYMTYEFGPNNLGSFASQAFSAVTLVSSVTTAPEPGTLSLFVLALALAGALWWAPRKTLHSFRKKSNP